MNAAELIREDEDNLGVAKDEARLGRESMRKFPRNSLVEQVPTTEKRDLDFN